MTSNLQRLSEKRKKWVEVNRENNFEEGIKRLLADMYPDNAHFIYELLQNAEDASATEVRFILKENSVEFEHNGSRLFSFKDVDSITSIGVSTKRDDATSIGKFGVGFKAVFAYTATPEIESGEYHFRIRDMVVPDETDLPMRVAKEKETRFVFPFGNPKKSPENARREIEENLRHLSENTLLFLSNIRKIEYLLPNSAYGSIERQDLEQNHIEIITKHPEESNSSPTIYLRFEKIVNVNDEDGVIKTCRIAIAFKLKRIQEQAAESLSGAESPRFKIEPITGQVSIYFPAEKETSNLRFHIHAPFASTVARDSVRDCPANNELRDHLADLVAEAMTSIRDQNLLTVEFLETLPNSKDSLGSFYVPIRHKLIEAFQKENLTPMKQGGHAPASRIYRGKVQLSNLVNDEDLAHILGKEAHVPLWVANPPQINQRADNFLSMLGISNWTVENLFENLTEKTEFMTEWMITKTDEWHQQFYALLGDFLSEAPQYYDPLDRKEKLSKLPVIRMSNGTYKSGEFSFFPSDDVEDDDSMPRIAKGIYTFGKSEKDQKKSKEFLKAIGVREVGEAEQIEAVLRRKYAVSTHDFDIKDIKRFVALVEKDAKKSEIFKDYLIFQAANEQWRKTSDIYLDSPYLETGLSEYYDSSGVGMICSPLSKAYESCGVEIEKLTRFAKAVGVKTALPISECSCRDNPDYGYGKRLEGGGTGYTDEDWTIKGLDNLLKHPNIRISRLVWDTMKDLDRKYFRAHYQKYQRSRLNSSSSQLMHHIENLSWVPQIEQETNLCKFVKPANADSDLLPPGFTFDHGWEWIRNVQFGTSVRQQKEAERLAAQKQTTQYQREEESAKNLNFDSVEDAKEAKELLDLKKKDPDGFRKWEKQSRKEKAAFPEKPVRNPERRQERMAAQVENSSDKQYEKRDRSVRTTSGEIDPKSWLRIQYTNELNQVICQICKEEMPFKGRDGEYYFEAVEALSRDYFGSENEAQYLALCPLCAAMYKEFVKRDETTMQSLIVSIKDYDTMEIPVNLGEIETSIQFVEGHWFDIKTILQKQDNDM